MAHYGWYPPNGIHSHVLFLQVPQQAAAEAIARPRQSAPHRGYLACGVLQETSMDNG